MHFLFCFYIFLSLPLRRVSARGCFAGDSSRAFGFHAPNGKLPYRPVTFDLTAALPLLSSETPGVAIWSCFVAPDRASAAELVAPLLCAPDSLTRYNAAIALGIIEDRRALPTLREIVRNRDCFYFKDCRRSNQFRSAIALCLLGRIGEAADAPLLREIVFDSTEFDRPLYHTLAPDYLYCSESNRNFVYFDLFTHAAAALLKLSRREGLDMLALHEDFKRLFSDDTVIRRVTAAPPDSPIYIEIADFEKYLLRMTGR